MTAMLAGLALAIGLLAYVLRPLIKRRTEAAGAMAARDPGDPGDPGVPSCSSCGARPEADAVFCSSCGRPLGS